MYKYNLFLFISIVSLSFLFVGCEDEGNPLIGTWNYTEVLVSNCENGIGNLSTDYSDDGDCNSSLGVTTCTQFSLIMDNENYTIHETITVDGAATTTTVDEGTYKTVDAIGSNIQFCTDVFCRSEFYTISNNVLMLESLNFSNDCVTRISAIKE